MSNGEVQLQPIHASDPEQGYRLQRNLPKISERWITIGGDCPALRNYLATKEGTCWSICKLVISFVRGYSQAVFANNPITGVILMTALAAYSPSTLLVCSSTGLLGHLLSLAVHEPPVSVDNGLGAFNSIIFGAVSSYFVPLIYGGYDGFSALLTVLCVVFIVYVYRACDNGGIPCLTMPFNLGLMILLFTLKNEADKRDIPTLMNLDNETAIAVEASRSIVENATTHVNASLDWGMVVRASLVSASQLFVTDSVALGAVVYLAVLIYSPITCLFGYVGSLGGSLVALLIGAPREAINAGLWGFNGYLTGAGLGGTLLVMNGHVAVATCVAVALTTFIQHVLLLVLPTGIPVGTIPFVLTAWLFIGLGKASDGAFNYPITMSSPEVQRREFLSRRKTAKLEQINEPSEPETLLRNGKDSLT